jgi:hypothetical protein
MTETEIGVVGRDHNRPPEVLEREHVAPVTPIFCSVEAATKIIAGSERAVIDLIARGIIKAVKSDRRTLVVVQSLYDYANSLPPAKLTPDNRGRRKRS